MKCSSSSQRSMINDDYSEQSTDDDDDHLIRKNREKNIKNLTTPPSKNQRDPSFMNHDVDGSIDSHTNNDWCMSIKIRHISPAMLHTDNDRQPFIIRPWLSFIRHSFTLLAPKLHSSISQAAKKTQKEIFHSSLLKLRRRAVKQIRMNGWMHDEQVNQQSSIHTYI